MLAALRALPLAARLITLAGLAAGLLAVLGGLYLGIRASGYRDGYAKAASDCATERARMEQANRDAIRTAEQQLIRSADQLATTQTELDHALAATDAATAADPHGSDQCLDADGLRRLNAYR